MERFCKDVKDQAMKIINYEKNEITLLTDKEKESHEKKKFVIYVRKNLVLTKNTVKSEIIVITQENLEELPIVFAIYVIKYQKKFL